MILIIDQERWIIDQKQINVFLARRFKLYFSRLPMKAIEMKGEKWNRYFCDKLNYVPDIFFPEIFHSFFFSYQLKQKYPSI